MQRRKSLLAEPPTTAGHIQRCAADSDVVRGHFHEKALNPLIMVSRGDDGRW